MKKFVLRVGFVAFLALSLMGCGANPVPGPTPATPPTPLPSGITVNNIHYELVNTIPEGVVTLGKRGYKVVEQDNGYLVVIQTGEKPSAGYGLEVQSVKDTGGKTEIIVNETEPKPGAMTATVMTYPRLALKIGRNIAPQFVVRNTKGQDFPAIDSEKSNDDSQSGLTKEAVGEYVGLADSHTAAIKIDGEEKSFQLNERVAAQLMASPIKAGQKVKITYTAKEPQLWLMSLESVK